MNSVWKTLPDDVPVDGATVWIRRWIWVAPFLAVWDEASASFLCSSGLVCPWYEIWRWRSTT